MKLGAHAAVLGAIMVGLLAARVLATTSTSECNSWESSEWSTHQFGCCTRLFCCTSDRRIVVGRTCD